MDRATARCAGLRVRHRLLALGDPRCWSPEDHGHAGNQSGRLGPERTPRPPRCRGTVEPGAAAGHGGRSGSSTDRPNGLLKSEGRLASWLNMQSIPGDPASSCPLRKVARPLLSGLLCVEQSGKASVRKIVDRTPPSVDACTSALQAGPMVVEQARAAVCDRDATAENANYSVICSLDESRLAVVVTRKPIALDDLAVWLAKPKTPDGTGGAGCRDAMVLNAGGAAGTMHARSQSYQLDGRKPTFSGPGSWPVASFLFVTPRTPEPAIPPPPRAINNAAKSVANVN
ncbi:hypothetical protein Ddc_19132 [Ditylenchus destructor]|nr:hypothetical protein Ddc_19132 [Ditylenchus destructor]